MHFIITWASKAFPVFYAENLIFANVNFLFPFFLIAGISIAIPILIHLFNFRKYKKVRFPDIRFLKELQEQTHKQSKLKNLLILLSRIAALLALVFAFAQPFWNSDRDAMQKGPLALSIYIDNSFSMGSLKGNLSLLDIAKGKAADIIEKSGPNDQIQVLSNDFGLNENKFMGRDEALQQLNQIRISARTRNVSSILDKQKKLLSTLPGRRQEIIYISDFQKSQFALNTPQTDSIRKYFVSVQPAKTNNLSLDTAYFENPSLLLNEPNLMAVRLKNNSDEAIQSSLTLLVNGQLKSVLNVELKPNELKNTSLSFNTSVAGDQRITLFTNDYPVSFDDTFYMAGKVSANYQVLVLNQSNANAFLSSVFKPGSQFRMDNHQVAAVSTDIFKNYSLIILNGSTNIPDPTFKALIQYVNEGGNLFVLPPANSNTGNLNGLLSALTGSSLSFYDTSKTFVTGYNKSHELFRDLFVKTPENIELPVVYKHHVIRNAAMSSEQKLFTFSNGDAFLTSYRAGNGKVFVCASSADIQSSSFPKSYWFLPVLYKMAFSGRQHAIHALTLGKNTGILLENNKQNNQTVYHSRLKNWDAIPEQRAVGNQVWVNLNQAAKEAGIYSVYLPGNADSLFTGVNYDRSESDMQYWDFETLKNQSKMRNAKWLNDEDDLSLGSGALAGNMPLWKVCIILALIFILIEIALIRWMK